LGSSTRCDVQAGPGDPKLAGRQSGNAICTSAPVESDQGCSEDGTRVPDDLLFAVGKTLSVLYAEWKTQLDTARRGFIMGLIGEDNMALAVNGCRARGRSSAR
jgi:hypothetical protein